MEAFEDIPDTVDSIARNSFCGAENCIENSTVGDDPFMMESCENLYANHLLGDPVLSCHDKATQTEDVRPTTLEQKSCIQFQDECTQTLSGFFQVLCEDKGVETPIITCENKEVQVKSGDIVAPFAQCISTDRQLYVMCGIRNHKILEKLVSLIAESYPEKRVHKLTLKDRVILTLMKLKLNLTFSALCIMFKCVDESTCRKLFHSMLPKVAQILQCTIRWVSRDEIQRNIPKCFAYFKKTVVVVDCTEFHVQKPKCLQCRIKLYSQYKSTLTVKYMTGVSPGGMLTFLSKGYGGRASDKLIFEQSNIINLLQKGDAVMTDKGFQVEDVCARQGVELLIPPFLRNKKQLSADEAIYNRFIAAARVHVERMNQRIRDFAILQTSIPWNLFHHTDEIVNVCAGLANLGTPIMSTDKFM